MAYRQPRLFISYSRVDKPFVRQLAEYLRQAYDNVWFDERLHGGELWWDEILKQIGQSDIFLYLLSPESLESSYCLTEFEEALRLQKKILPILIRERTVIPPVISRFQYVDMSLGFKARSINSLQASLARLTRELPVEPPDPLDPHPLPPPLFSDRVPTIARFKWPLIIGLLMVLATVIGVSVVGLVNAAQNGASRTNETPSAVAQATFAPNAVTVSTSIPTTLPTNSLELTATSTSTSTATSTVTNTFKPTTTPTPTATDMPTATPSATSILSASGARTTFRDDFDGSVLSYYWHSKGNSTPNLENGNLVLQGQGNWNDGIFRGNITQGMGILILFQIVQHGDWNFSLSSGLWQTNSYRSVIFNDGRQLGEDVGTKDYSAYRNMALEENKWYYLLWRVNKGGAFDTFVWERGTPLEYVFRDQSIPTDDSWDGYTWQFVMGASTGIVKIHSYEELQFPADYRIPSAPPQNS